MFAKLSLWNVYIQPGQAIDAAAGLLSSMLCHIMSALLEASPVPWDEGRGR